MKIHLSRVVTRTRFGVPCTITGSLCGRLSNAGDDMNATTDRAAVTCNLCLKQMERDADREAWLARRAAKKQATAQGESE